MFVLNIRKKTAIGKTAVTRCFLYIEKLGPNGEGGEPAPCTITRSCVFLDHNLKLSLNRALLKWWFRKVATLHWRLLLRPQVAIQGGAINRGLFVTGPSPPLSGLRGAR